MLFRVAPKCGLAGDAEFLHHPDSGSKISATVQPATSFAFPGRNALGLAIGRTPAPADRLKAEPELKSCRSIT